MAVEAIIAGVAIALEAGTAVYSADQSRKATHQQMDQAKKLAAKPGIQQAKSPVVATSKRNLNNATIASGLGDKGGGTLGGTLLSGPGGVPDSAYNTGGGSGTLLGG